MVNSVLDKGTMFIIQAEKIFLNPHPLYDYNSIVEGCVVKDKFGENKIMRAVDTNTYRGFERINKDEEGASRIYITYFLKNKLKIIEQLIKVKTLDELNNFSNILYLEMEKLLLEGNIKEQKIIYNRVRFPIDLFIEHIVCMSEELKSERKKLVPLLFVPLDKHTISKCFKEKDLFVKNNKFIKGIGDIDTKEEYYRLQNILYKNSLKMSNEFGKKYYRIYSELLWKDRSINMFAGNLFETNFSYK